MARPLRNQKKKAVTFLGEMLELQVRKDTIRKPIPQRRGCGNSSHKALKTLCKQGQLREALQVLHVMDQRVDNSTYVCLLQTCIKKKALSEGKLVHNHINDRGFPDIFLGNTLVYMYVKCGSLVDARRVFDDMPKRDAFSYNVMIVAYSKHGFAEDALTLFQQMQRTGTQPNQFTFASVLPACADLAAMEPGIEIHQEIITNGFQSDVFVGNALIDMYAKCGKIETARHLFDKMPRRDEASWNSLIAAYTRHGLFVEALTLFQLMQRTGIRPNQRTFASVLPACANLASLEQGVEVHEEIVRSGFQSNVFVMSALVDMYAKCGNIESARQLFDEITQRDAVSWNGMIAAYTRHGPFKEALTLFHEMQQTGIQPTQRTYVIVLAACASLTALEEGIEIHKEIIKSGFQSDVYAQGALVDMYAKCGSIERARVLFDKMPQQNAISWSTMIAGYTENGQVDEARKLFQEMPEPSMISWTAMITGYMQMGCIDEALKLFQEMPERDIVSWTTMIAGYVHNGQALEALKLFRQMQLAGVKPNANTFASVLPACANLAALEQGMDIHEDIIRSGFQSHVFVESALVDMYAKCGSIKVARSLFDKMRERDVVSWTAMIAGYAMHGCGKEALKLFEQMQYSGMNPNHVTLVSVLTACCHAGLVDEGQQYFHRMSQYYHIAPAMEHYVCMVDLLGRAGHLNEARDFINKMPMKPDATVWTCLLGACRMHNNIELGESVAALLFELDPKSVAPYVLLSNIYSAAGRWDDSENVRSMMKDRGIKKKPGCSWIEVNKYVHAFLVGDKSHPQTENLCKAGEIV
eukprot:Gb_32451 [translate_table: standard]